MTVMIIEVEHQDSAGKTKNLRFKLQYATFIKHFAFAGMGASRSSYHYFRFLGIMLEFMPYWRNSPDYFWIPDLIRNDPTELGQISNKIGKGLADFLAKQIYGARYTHNYEDAMVRHGHPVKGKRPDLYCDTLSKQFAIESKGFKKLSVSHNQMMLHKAQSREGPIPVHFSVASVAYQIYSNPKVKFHDPVGQDFEYSREINIRLINDYYRSIINLIETHELRLVENETFPKDFVAFDFGSRIWFHPKVYLLVHKSILSGKWEEFVQSFSEMSINEDYNYIDVDGIGIAIRGDKLFEGGTGTNNGLEEFMI